ncbi:MAG TPA: MFS transporter [Methylomirabilota bacterium]
MYYGFPVFLAAMERDLDASRVAITGAFTVGMAVAALAALPVGRWLDRRGPWALMTLGSCLGAALVVAWSHVHSLGALYAVWILMGLALAATLYEPAFGAVVRWFPTRHRDRALTAVTPGRSPRQHDLHAGLRRPARARRLAARAAGPRRDPRRPHHPAACDRASSPAPSRRRPRPAGRRR